jgi:hypothetical protein
LYCFVTGFDFNSPSEFGNLTLTTCYIGGSQGIVNCSGIGYFDSLVASSVTGNVTANWNTMINIPSDFSDNIDDNTNCSSDLSCNPITYDSELAYVGNCSEDLSCNPIAYDSELAYVGNCSEDLSCNPIAYDSELAFITTTEWITPAHIIDVDDEDIETDVNTYVDIIGDSMTGNLVTTADIELEGGGICIDSGGCAVSSNYLEIELGALCIDDDGSLACAAPAGDAWLMDGTLKVMENDGYTCSFATIDGEGCFEKDIESGASIYASNFFDDGTQLSDLFVSRTSWITIDNYPTGCTGFSVVQSIGDSLSCYTPQLLGDVSPQLGGYLDTNSYNLGSTADEIENIYIATNSKIYLGNNQEGEIYYDGSKIIIKVN